MDLLRSFPQPSAIPKFLKKRRKSSRALCLLDYVRPVQTEAERQLFMSCYLMHTRQGRQSFYTDWTACTKEFNTMVVRIWEENKSVSDVYIKEESHLRAYEKSMVRLASTHEVARTAAVLQEARNADGQGVSLAPAGQSVPLQPESGPTPTPAVEQQVRGQGLGGAGGTRECRNCSRAFAEFVPKLGHNCIEFYIHKGRNPRDLPGFSLAKHGSMSKEAASRELNKRKDKAEKDRKRKRG